MAMNCIDLETEWAERIDQDFSCESHWSSEARQHFARCADCRRRLAIDAQLDRAISAWKSETPPPVDLDRLAEKLLSDPSLWAQKRSAPAKELTALPRVRRRSAPLLLGTSAAVLLLTAGVLMLNSLGPDKLAPPVASQEGGGTTSTEAHVAGADVTGTFAEIWQDVRTSPAIVAQKTVASLERLPSGTSDHLASVSVVAESVPEVGTDQTSWTGWGKPLGQRVGGAFRFLSDVLPVEGPPAS